MVADWKNPCYGVIAEPGGVATCAISWFLPCVTYGMNLSKLGGAPADSNVWCAGDSTKGCLLYCCATIVGCGCVVHIPTRQYIRKKYGVAEPTHGIIEDLLLTWCCPCCTVIQEYNEILTHEGAAPGAMFTDIKNATAAATADVKKGAAAAVDATKQAVKPKDAEKDGKEEVKEEAKEAVVEAKAEHKDAVTEMKPAVPEAKTAVAEAKEEVKEVVTETKETVTELKAAVTEAPAPAKAE